MTKVWMHAYVHASAFFALALSAASAFFTAASALAVFSCRTVEHHMRCATVLCSACGVLLGCDSQCGCKCSDHWNPLCNMATCAIWPPVQRVNAALSAPLGVSCTCARIVVRRIDARSEPLTAFFLACVRVHACVQACASMCARAPVCACVRAFLSEADTLGVCPAGCDMALSLYGSS